MTPAARGGNSSRDPGRWGSLRRAFGDPYLLYTSTLTPVVVVVALARGEPTEIALALSLSVAAITTQAAVGRLPRRRAAAGPRARALVRISIPLLYVGLSAHLIGGPTLPLSALFVPVVAGAAAIGTFEGWATAGVAAAIYLLPEIGALGSPAAVGLRGVVLAGVSCVLAFGTHRIVRALQDAVHDARRAMARERRRARQLAALETVNRMLATDGPLADLLGGVLKSVVSELGYPYASVYLGDETRVRLVAQEGYPNALPAFEPTVGVAGRVMRTRRVALVPDVAADLDYVPGTVPTTSLICAPLLAGDRFIGLLNVETGGARRLDATDRSLVSIVATRVATAVELNRERRALADRADLFRGIERFSRDVSGTLDVEPLASAILRALGAVVAADTLAVTLLDRTDGRYRIRAVRGVPPEAVGRTVNPGEGLAGRAIRDRALVIDDTLTPDKHPASVRDLELPPLTSGVGVPLVRDGVVVGALTIGRTADGAEFTGLELEGLQLLAAHAALAVANAFLHAEVEELAIRDPLTGLFNRRHLDEALDRMLAHRQRQRLSGGWQPLSVALFDLDRFGTFNKEHGHQVGDGVLRAFADVLRVRFRASDLVARIGGDEFLVVLDGADRDAAIAAANEVRKRLAETTVPSADGRPLGVAVSAGCAELDPAEASREALLRTADVALFMAKRAGRDRVVAA